MGDADDPVDSSDSDGDDSDDDTAVLMAELNKIKAEKARDEAEKEAGRREEEEQIRMENILSGNPLLKEKYSDTGKTDMKIKKRWDDDVVSKTAQEQNQMPGSPTLSTTASATSFTKDSWTSTSSRICEWYPTGTWRKDFVNIIRSLWIEVEFNDRLVL